MASVIVESYLGFPKTEMMYCYGNLLTEENSKTKP
jgi:hypothetical protein